MQSLLMAAPKGCATAPMIVCASLSTFNVPRESPDHAAKIGRMLSRRSTCALRASPFVALRGNFASADDKKLNTTLKRIGVTNIPAIEEVNMFTNDGEVIHFVGPKGKWTKGCVKRSALRCTHPTVDSVRQVCWEMLHYLQLQITYIGTCACFCCSVS